MKRYFSAALVCLAALALLATACSAPAATPAPTTTLPTVAVQAPTAAPTDTPSAPSAQVTTAPNAAPTALATTAPNAAPPLAAATDTPVPVVPTAVPPVANTPSANSGATPAPGTTPAASGQTAANCIRWTFVSDVTMPDGTVVAPGQQFDKTWRIRNSGTCAWNGFELAFNRGEAMTATTAVPVPATAPGATVDLTVSLTAPSTPGSYTGFWRLRNANGTVYAGDLWVKITSRSAPAQAPTVAPSSSANCTNAATFVSDVTVPDNTVVAPGEQFTKTWRIRNSGTCAWSGNEHLAFLRGEAMTSTTSVAVPATAPGATVDVSIPMTASTTAGTHSGFWRLRTANGTNFGNTLWVIVRVSGAPAPAPTLGAPTPGASSNLGVTVAGLTLNPSTPTFQDQIGFNVTFNNTSGTDQSVQWLVKLYQCPDPCDNSAIVSTLTDLRRSFGQTGLVTSVIPSGTSVMTTPQNWVPRAGACSYVAVPHMIDPVGQSVTPLFQANGVPLYQRFQVC